MKNIGVKDEVGYRISMVSLKIRLDSFEDRPPRASIQPSPILLSVRCNTRVDSDVDTPP
jgi:hypothetical protein